MGFGKLVVGFISDEMDNVNIEVESSLANSVVNGYEPSSPSHISSTSFSKEPAQEPAEDAIESYQCPLPTCSVCGSLVERGTYCPKLYDLIIIED